MPKKILGLGIDDYAIKLVEATQHRSGISISKLDDLKLDTNNSFDPIYKAVSASIKSNFISTKEVVIALAGKNLHYFSVETPLLPDNETENEIKFRIETFLPFTLTDAVVSFYKTDHSIDNTQRYFVCAAKKSAIKDLISQAEKAGLKVKDVVPASEALKALLPKSSTTTALLYKTPFTSLLTVYKNNVAVYAKAYDNDQTAEIEKDANRFNAEVFVTGEGHSLSAKKLSLIPQSCGTTSNEVFHSMSLGICACEAQTYELSLLPKELKSHAKRFIKKNSNHKTAYALVFSILILLFLSLFRIDSGLKSDLSGMRSEKDRLSKKVLASNLSFLKDTKTSIKSDVFFKIMKQLESTTPDYIFFQGISYDRKDQALTIKGIFMNSEGSPGASGFISSLRRDNIFEAVELIYIKKSDRYEFPVSEFELKCMLKKEGNKEW